MAVLLSMWAQGSIFLLWLALTNRAGSIVLTYKAMFKFADDGVHAEVLDFPGVITCGQDLAAARRLLASALVDMAEASLNNGEALPRPDANTTDVEADLEEPIHLMLKASSRVEMVSLDAT